MPSHPDGLTIVNPWSTQVGNLDRCRHYFRLLKKGYCGTYPAVDYFPQMESLLQAVEEGNFLIWLAYIDNQIIGTSSIEIQDGIASLVSSVNVERKVNIGILLYKRIIDLLEWNESIWAIDGEIRLTRNIEIAGTQIESGVKSQHINLKCGLKPYLFCYPKYSMKGRLRGKRQFLLFARKLFEPAIFDPVVFTPFPPNNRVGIAEILNLSCKINNEIAPTFSHDVAQTANDQSGYVHICRNGHPQFATAYLSGALTLDRIAGVVRQELEAVDYLELVTLNSPSNLYIQEAFYSLHAIPIGVLPNNLFWKGPKEKLYGTTIHFGLLKNTNKNTFLPVDFCNELSFASSKETMYRLMQEWKKNESSFEY